MHRGARGRAGVQTLPLLYLKLYVFFFVRCLRNRGPPSGQAPWEVQNFISMIEYSLKRVHATEWLHMGPWEMDRETLLYVDPEVGFGPSGPPEVRAFWMHGKGMMHRPVAQCCPERMPHSLHVRGKRAPQQQNKALNSVGKSTRSTFARPTWRGWR